MPTEAEMRPRDKYTMFVRYGKNYRKGIHSMLQYSLRPAIELTIGRTSQVDESEPAIESTWILEFAL